MLLYAIIRGNAREIDMIIDPHRRPTLYVYGKADIDHFVFVTMYAGYVGVYVCTVKRKLLIEMT